MICDFVSGNTKTLGIIGNPIAHTFSPFIHNTISKRLGNDYIYTPFLVEEHSVEHAVRGAHALGIQGINVTVPYKKNVMPYLHSAEVSAKAAGAVNTLKYTQNGYEGYNTDIIGVMNTLKYAEVDISGKTTLVLGAGGSACAVIAALCEMGAKRIFIHNRTLGTAVELAERMAQYYRSADFECLAFIEASRFEEIEVMIQTTTMGFGAQKGLSPMKDKSLFKKTAFVFDLIYSPWETTFLKIARESGCEAVNGFNMLVYQAVASYEIWTGHKFDEDFVKNIKDELAEFYLKNIIE